MKRFAVCLTYTCFLFAWVLPAVAQDEEKKSSPEALNVYSDAANFQNAGEFKLAVDEWTKFIKKFPNDPLVGSAHHYLGVCSMQLKPTPWDKAEAAFQTVVTQHPKFEMLEDSYLNLGWCQYQQAQGGKAAKYADAEKTFAALVEKYPKGKFTDQGLFFRGESLYLQDKREEATASYDALIKNHPKSGMRADGLYALGVTYEELAKYPQAGATYDIFIKEFAENALITEIRMRKAETVLQAGLALEADKPAEAKPLFAQAEKMFGDAAAVEGFESVDHSISRQALSALKQGKFGDAGKLYAKIASDFPESDYKKESILSAGRSFYRAGELADSAKWFKLVLDGGDANAPEAGHWLCRIDIGDKKYQEAADLAAKMIPAAAESEYLVNLKMDQADALYELPDKREESLGLYVKIATDHADHTQAPQALYNAGFAALDLKKYADGVTHSAAFIEKYPDHNLVPDVKYVAAECNIQLAKYPEAEAGFADLVAKHAGHADIEQWRVRLGLTRYLQKKYQETVDTMTPALAGIQAPANAAEANFLIGGSQFYLNKMGEAVKSLSAAHAASQNWARADETLLILSQAYRKQNKLDDAVKTIKQMISAFPQSRLLDRAHFRHGEYSFATADYATAAAQYNTTVTKWPESVYTPYALYGKGWAHLKAAEHAPGIAAFTALIDNHPDHRMVPDSHFARAMCYRQDGKFNEAIGDCDAFLKSDPALTQKSTARYEKGLAQMALKDNEAAAATFTTLLEEDKAYASADKVLYELGWAYKNQKKNDDAVKAFTALATNYADSPSAPEANYHVGEDLYQKEEYESAAKFYTATKSKAGTSVLGEKATYKLGWANFQQKKYDAALQEFTAQVATYADGTLSPDGKFMKAETTFKLEKYPEAWPAFQEAKKATDGSDRTPEVIKVLILLHGGQSASQEKKYQEAFTWLSAIPEKHKESAYVAEALYEMGFAQQNQDKLAEALALYDQAADKSRDKVGARARFMRGEVLFTQKEFPAAIKEFTRVMYGYRGPKNSLADVKPWQAKSGFEAGRCSEVQIQSAQGAAKSAAIENARKYYSYVTTNFPDDPLAADAKKRLDALAKLN